MIAGHAIRSRRRPRPAAVRARSGGRPGLLDDRRLRGAGPRAADAGRALVYGDLCRRRSSPPPRTASPGPGPASRSAASCPSERTPAAGSTRSRSAARSRGSATAPARVRPARADRAGPRADPGRHTGTRPQRPPAAIAADLTGPRLSVRRSARQRIRGGRAVRLTVNVSEPATVGTSLRVRGRGHAALRFVHACARIPGVSGSPRPAPAGSGCAGPSRAAHAWRRSTVTAPDAFGNTSRATRRVRRR